jgi:hypothetical protein
MSRDDPANPGGSSYGSGWYGYVEKDLRTLLGRPVAGRFSRSYCGNGVLTACRDALWSALEAADPGGAPAPDPRIAFPGFLPATMRWTNRPTFQQVVSFASHR